MSKKQKFKIGDVCVVTGDIEVYDHGFPTNEIVTIVDESPYDYEFRCGNKNHNGWWVHANDLMLKSEWDKLNGETSGSKTLEGVGSKASSHPHASLIIAYANDTTLEFEYFNTYDNVRYNNDIYDVINDDQGKITFRIKQKELHNYLIYAEGKYSVTNNQHASESEVKAAYNYPVDVIQKLENR